MGLYKHELANHLEKTDRSRASFWMDRHFELNGSEYHRVHLQGDGLCAKMDLLVLESHAGIENLLKRKGIGYAGARLEGLKFDIIQDSTKTEFVFREVDKIIG